MFERKIKTFGRRTNDFKKMVFLAGSRGPIMMNALTILLLHLSGIYHEVFLLAL